MTPNATIAAAIRAGVSLSLEDGRLRYRSPAGALTPDLRAGLTAHKAEVIHMLSTAPDSKEYGEHLTGYLASLGWARRACYLCGGTRRRTRPGGDTICATCHPEEARPSFSLDHLSAGKGRRR